MLDCVGTVPEHLLKPCCHVQSVSLHASRSGTEEMRMFNVPLAFFNMQVLFAIDVP